jgi:hypothetical protein
MAFTQVLINQITERKPPELVVRIGQFPEPGEAIFHFGCKLESARKTPQK